MAQVIWSPQALDDVDAIAEYIARDSPINATLIVERLKEASFRIAEFPYAGRVIPEIHRADRHEVIVGPFRMMYRIIGRTIRITAVIHGARLWRGR